MGCHFKYVVREDLLERVTFEQSLEGGESQW